MHCNAAITALQEQANAASALAASAQGGFVRALPVDAACSERQGFQDLTFVDHAAKVSAEPKLTAAGA